MTNDLFLLSGSISLKHHNCSKLHITRKGLLRYVLSDSQSWSHRLVWAVMQLPGLRPRGLDIDPKERSNGLRRMYPGFQ